MIKTVFKSTLLFALSLCSLTSLAQSVGALRINEVLVVNETNLVDGFGQRGSWVEIYNNSAATVNIAACFLSDDLNNPRKYPIPQGDAQTQIKPRQHVVFWIDAAPTRGTFHTNFKFDLERSNFIALFDSDGVTLIDSVTIPARQAADISYARVVDGQLPWETLTAVTPGSNNKILTEKGNIEFFKTHDPYGIVVTLISMLVVGLSLAILYLTFKGIGKLAVRMVKNKSVESGATIEQATASIDVPGDIYAAIALALYEHATSWHDEESSIITINRVKRRYSPWSSKIHTLRDVPQRSITKKPITK